MKLLLTAALVALPIFVQARLGETEGQAQVRYGQPREDLAVGTDKPLLTGAIERSYLYQGFRVRSAYAGGTCMVIEYAHVPENGTPKAVTEPEIKAILEGEKGTSRWKEDKVKAAGPYAEIAKGIKDALKLNKWERNDGATAELALGLVLKITDKNADDWAKKIARDKAKQPVKPGEPKKPEPAIPKF
jgi:hypothetical protein